MRVLSTLFVLGILGCQGGALPSPDGRPDPGPEAEPQPGAGGREVVLQLRYDEVVSHGALRLWLLDLNDSRCPIGVECVWEGQVVAVVEAAPDGQTPRQVELVLRPAGEPAWQPVADHALRLLEVEPHPRDGVTPGRADYVATVELR